MDSAKKQAPSAGLICVRRSSVVSSFLFVLLLCVGASAQAPPTTPVVFASRTDFATGANPTRFDIADVNADGHLDVVTANFYTNTTVSVLLGNGDGTFDPHQDYEVGYVPYAVKIADFNHDEKPDLAATNREPGTVSILIGNGDGTFQPRVAYPAGGGPVTLAVADLNADGHAGARWPNNGCSGRHQLQRDGDQRQRLSVDRRELHV